MIRRRRDLWPIAGALLGAACVPDFQAPGGGRGGTEAPAGPGGARGTGRPLRGGTLTLALPRDANNFDPLRSNDAYSNTVMATVLDSLYELDQEGKVRGRLVEKTENPQPNVYLMTLRRGVAFHDGTPLDAEAVRFNLRRHLETPGSARGQDVRDITDLEVLDPLTLRVTLRAPFAPFPGKLIGGAGY
ncbi:MAG TPA: ABC transporter substrate-binding protein, partial [Chloroflexota bacterium]|nr:ABC transporter substrate-binding protein [Chloroflexota bacterium]